MGNSNTTPAAQTPKPLPYSLLQDVAGFPSLAESMSLNMDGKERHPTAEAYLHDDFRLNRLELAQNLYAYFNLTVFDNLLPADLKITFSNQMCRASGTTLWYKGGLRQGSKRLCQIYLSIRHLENSERLRNTLAHEMCHAAVWIIEGIEDSRDQGHGPDWIRWTQRLQSIHPSVNIQRYYKNPEYSKHLYECTTCHYDIGRSKPFPESSDKTCKKCGGVFEMVEVTDPRLEKEVNKIWLSNLF